MIVLAYVTLCQEAHYESCKGKESRSFKFKHMYLFSQAQAGQVQQPPGLCIVGQHLSERKTQVS